jgi:hypothetical protein
MAIKLKTLSIFWPQFHDRSLVWSCDDVFDEYFDLVKHLVQGQVVRVDHIPVVFHQVVVVGSHFGLKLLRLIPLVSKSSTFGSLLRAHVKKANHI